MTTTEEHPDNIIVIGSGIAGLSAAITAAEQMREGQGRVILVDRAPKEEAGGLTKWTSAYFRLDDVYDPGETFVSDIMDFSDGRTPRWYVEQLAEQIPESMEWIQGLGVRFKRLPTYFINSSRKRLQPVGGGEGMLGALVPAAEKLGVEFRYDTTATSLDMTASGEVRGLHVIGPAGHSTLAASSVIIASGGFEGDTEFLTRELGTAEPLIPIAPGVAFNRGEGIQMALDVGAARSGEWDGFHAEPVDPRSATPESLVMVFPYGILVNKDALRFVDEGSNTVDEIYESTARAIWAERDGTAYFITDQQFTSIEARARGILTSVKPIVADTIEQLATSLELPVDALTATVHQFNAAVGEGTFDWKSLDGKRTHGIEPAKSNWARTISEAPYIAYPIKCGIVFTFGGLSTNADAEVLDEQGNAIPGLYAAGECTGIYHGKYPGGTSVLRGMIFGRLAGKAAALRMSLSLEETRTSQ